MFGSCVRNVVVLGMAASGALLHPTSPVTASTPTLLWTGATSLGVQCLVQRGALRNDIALSATLCARALRIARRGAPMPVETIDPGDPALMQPGTVTLLIHASVETVRGGRVLAFSVRPFRAASDQGTTLFVAAPRAVPIADDRLANAELDTALAGVLAETLPWQAKPSGPRPIR